MSRPLLLAAEAQSDIADAIECLNDRSPESSDRFNHEVEAVFELIVRGRFD